MRSPHGDDGTGCPGWPCRGLLQLVGTVGSLQSPGTPCGLDLPYGIPYGFRSARGCGCCGSVPVGSSSGVLLGAAAGTALTCGIPVPCRGKESRRTMMTLQEHGEEAPAAAGDFQNAVICCLCKSGTRINLVGREGEGEGC